MSLDAAIGRLLEDEMQQLRQDMVTRLEQVGKSVTGRTASSIRVVANGKQAQLEVPPQLLTLETGRGPARSGGGDKQQFIENLKAWIVAKGIPYSDEQDLQRLANFFRWYINKFGTKQYREGRREDIFSSAIARFADTLSIKASSLYVEGLRKMR